MAAEVYIPVLNVEPRKRECLLMLLPLGTNIYIPYIIGANTALSVRSVVTVTGSSL